MGPLDDADLEDHRDTARLGLKAIRAYLAYQGNNQDIRDKAKYGAVAVMAHVRLRAAEANRMQVEFVSQRTLASPVARLGS